MEQDVRVRVTEKAEPGRDVDAAEHEPPARGEFVGVESDSSAVLGLVATTPVGEWRVQVR